MTASELDMLKKDLHYRFGYRTQFTHTEVVAGINEVIEAAKGGLTGAYSPSADKPTREQVMAANEREFDRLKREAGIDKPKVDEPADPLDTVMVDEAEPPPKKRRGRQPKPIRDIA